MKVSVGISVADLIPVHKALLEKIISLVIRSEKTTMFQKLAIGDILPSFKKSGVNGIELLISFNTSDEDLIQIKKIIGKYGLPVMSIHQSLKSFFNIDFSEIERLCDIANTFSAKVVVLHTEALGKRLFDNNFTDNLKALQKKYQVIFGLENVPKSPLSRRNSFVWKGDEFASVIKNANLNITLDTTHFGQVGEDICKFYLENQERIVNIHISDYRKDWINTVLSLEKGTHLSLGKGELPINKFLTLLKKTKYKGLITMEINSTLDEIVKSAATISNY